MAKIKATTCLASAPPRRRPLPSHRHSCRQPVIVPSQSRLGSPAIPASAAQLQIEQSPWVGFLCTLPMISGKAVALGPCRCGGSCLPCAWAWEEQTPGTPEREKQRQKRKNVFLSILGAHVFLASPHPFTMLFHHGMSTNLDRILKSRDITLPTKIRLGKAMVFPVVMYGCES